MRRVEIPTLQLCSVPGCPDEVDYHATHGKCGPCARQETASSRFEAERQALRRGKKLPTTQPRPRIGRRRPRQLVTEAERVVLQALADGLTDGQIAALTSKSIHTVRNSIRRLRMKLHIADRAELVAEARRRGLIE